MPASAVRPAGFRVIIHVIRNEAPTAKQATVANECPTMNDCSSQALAAQQALTWQQAHNDVTTQSLNRTTQHMPRLPPVYSITCLPKSLVPSAT